MNKLVIAAALALIGAVPSGAPAAPSASDVLARMTADRASLNTFKVRVGFEIDLRAFLHLHFSPKATYYFKRPDKSELVFDSLPPAAQQFQHFYGSLGTPETWPATYDISLTSASADAGGHPLYQLKLVPKNNGGSLDYVQMSVDARDYGVVQEEWFYKSGATIIMQQSNERLGKFVLPKQQIADFNFPSYKAHAVSTYDGYHLNVDVPDSVFTNS